MAIGKKVWCHQIWIPNNLGFLVSDLTYILGCKPLAAVFCFIWTGYGPFGDCLKVSWSWNKIVEPKIFPKNQQTNLFFYPDDSEILETKILISISNFKYFWVVKIEKQIRSFIFLVKLGLNGLVSRSTDLYQLLNRWLEILKVSHYSKHICTLMSEWLDWWC